MNSANFIRFLRSLAVLSALAVLLLAIVLPPDPFTQLLYSGPLLIGALLLSYVHAYTNRLEAFERVR
ncbi:DUF7534 family protein [Natrinema gelatinilyticum]|uniref:DUF7534 family protein n=1 Tax=Natrinema gelatinilyticum TaxID=2961571 RepID=UPI0020C4CD8A|nr:hypothetical protein [Natrinema gelatinilyticum]